MKIDKYLLAHWLNKNFKYKDYPEEINCPHVSECYEVKKIQKKEDFTSFKANDLEILVNHDRVIGVLLEELDLESFSKKFLGHENIHIQIFFEKEEYQKKYYKLDHNHLCYKDKFDSILNVVKKPIYYYQMGSMIIIQDQEETIISPNHDKVKLTFLLGSIKMLDIEKTED